MGPARYSRAAIALHWAIALAIAFQIILGWRLETLTAATGQFHAFQLHKSVGITILLLSLARVGVRFWKPRPPAEADKGWAKTAAGAVHFLLYAFMILAPLSGWVLVSTSKIQVPTLLYGVVPWPHIPGLDGAMRGNIHEAAEATHSALVWIAISLFVLHVGGALRHQWLLKQRMIERMLPVGPQTRFGFFGSLFIYGTALFILWLAMAFAWFVPVTGSPPATATPAAAPAAIEAPLAAEPAETAVEANVTETADNATAAAEEEKDVKAAEWRVSSGGHLGFTASFTGSPVFGTFKRWDADIRFDPEALDKSDIRVSIDMASADTEDASRDETLKGGDFFAVTEHARATFRSTKVTARGPGRYRASGTLTLKGVSRPAVIDFTLKINGDRADVTGSGAIERNDFGVGTGEWQATDRIAGRVTIDFRFAAIRKD
ncbi:YceI family protein [Sphingomonas sp. DBB INV C78]|uniref:YceI family protein n=1 Tax=Sphingomonas sp. DBB INV C78 TaxID=3349434 RepID=UPI0036D315CE